MMLTAEQVAKKLGVAVSTVRKMYREGRLKGVKLGHRTVRSAEVEKMLEACE